MKRCFVKFLILFLMCSYTINIYSMIPMSELFKLKNGTFEKISDVERVIRSINYLRGSIHMLKHLSFINMQQEDLEIASHMQMLDYVLYLCYYPDSSDNVLNEQQIKELHSLKLIDEKLKISSTVKNVILSWVKLEYTKTNNLYFKFEANTPYIGIPLSVFAP